jgi:hypothetical protein
MTTAALTLQLSIVRKDAARRMVYGWAYVAKDTAGDQVFDHSGEFVAHVDELEKAFHQFMKSSRDSGERHDGQDHGNIVVECVVFTKAKLAAMGIPEGVVPQGAWIGVEVSAATFEKVKDGSLLSFSIEGEAEKVAA